jgi:predicted secreted protein with PEFG-CTERM motif
MAFMQSTKMNKILFVIIVSLFILLTWLQSALAVTQESNPHEPSWDSIKVNTITNKIYASSTASPNILVIDGSSDTLVQTIPAPNYPTKLVVDPHANMVFALPALLREIVVINGSTDKITGTINWTSSGEPPHSININTDTKMVYVTAGAEGLISINSTSNTIKNVLSSLGSGDMVIDPTRNIIYYSDSSNEVFKIINASTNSFINTPFVPFAFTAIIDTRTNKTYDGLGKVVDLSTNHISFAPISVNKNASAGVGSVVINPKSDTIYLKPLNSYDISIINGTSNSMIGTIPIANAYSMDVNPNTNRLYVNSDDKIQVIDTTSNKVIGTIPLNSTVPEFGVTSMIVLFVAVTAITVLTMTSRQKFFLYK